MKGYKDKVDAGIVSNYKLPKWTFINAETDHIQHNSFSIKDITERVKYLHGFIEPLIW